MFREESVLEALVQLFRERGFERVSLKEMEARTGLNRSSLYNTFGGKDALFARALDRYLEEVEGRILAPLEEGTEGIADLHAFVDRLTVWFSAPEAGAGCLMVNSMVEFGGANGRVVEEACRYVDRFRKAATAAFDRAAQSGEIPRASVESRVNLLIGMVLGIHVASRSDVPGLAPQLVETLRAEVASWDRPAR